MRNEPTKPECLSILQVTDTNDNAPTFQSTAYSFDVPENVPRGSRIGQVVATDADANGPNSQLSYTLISDWANDVFSLNPSTGVFTLTASLDYEQVRTIVDPWKSIFRKRVKRFGNTVHTRYVVFVFQLKTSDALAVGKSTFHRCLPEPEQTTPMMRFV